ncbi:MAG: co-chaperone GroES family protein [Candidatus Heimdallarchaeaceae archaeon]
MKIQPLPGKILLKPIIKEHKTESGILLPENINRDVPGRGIVEATNKDSTFEIGQEVLFIRYEASEVEINKEKYLIAEEADILAIINKDVTKKSS